MPIVFTVTWGPLTSADGKRLSAGRVMNLRRRQHAIAIQAAIPLPNAQQAARAISKRSHVGTKSPQIPDWRLFRTWR
jgi:hypothetical protein